MWIAIITNSVIRILQEICGFLIPTQNLKVVVFHVMYLVQSETRSRSRFFKNILLVKLET